MESFIRGERPVYSLGNFKKLLKLELGFTPKFVVVNAFLTVLKNKGEIPGITRFENPLKECCGGVCGVVDEKGVKNYTLCDDPTSTLFWDGLHPTQEGWKSVYAVLGKNLTASLIKA